MSVLERRRRTDPRREQTERAFISAAAELLAEGASFAELPVSRIAERAKRPRTAFYAHFPDRRDLLLRLVEDFVADAMDAIEPFVRSLRRRDVQAALENLLATFRAHQVSVRALNEAAGYDAVVAARFDALVDGFRSIVRHRLRDAGHSGDEGAAVVLVAMTERSCIQQVTRPEPALLSDDELVAALTDAWWRALRT